MSKIKVLSPQIAERIAAGEVIERPASVVKELVENSLDAGATEIQILLEDGGKGLIEILDNGQGIAPDDLGTAVKRHATSKLSTLDDLERIRTLGFRGEALPSIAAVSDLSILSRTTDSETAYEFFAGPFEAPRKPAPVTFGTFANSMHGTRVRAVGLFSQVPARLKFLKSQAAEVSFVREWVERLAVGKSGVGFKLMSSDRTILNLRPTTEPNRVQQILSDDETYPLLSADVDQGYLKIRAHWIQGLSTPQTRRVVQVVNGRAVRDRMLQQAILSPFRQALLPGQFPAVALFVEIDPSEIDVNVHPTKSEIRFLSSRDIFRSVERLVESLIEKHGAPTYAGGSSNFAVSEIGFGTPASNATMAEWPTSATSVSQSGPSWTTPSILTHQPSLGLDRLPPTQRSPESDASTNTAPLPDFLRSGRYVGALFNTYLVYDLGQELVLVDQHAAHERIRYELLRSQVLERRASISVQELLIPEAIRFPQEERPQLEARLEILAQMGFGAEVFSEDTVLFRAVPAEWGQASLKTRLKGLLDRLLAYDSPTAQLMLDETLFEKLASEACHSAVRAGDQLDRLEAETITGKLFECQHPWNCPHGRPTVVRVPRGKIEEWFQRRV